MVQTGVTWLPPCAKDVPTPLVCGPYPCDRGTALSSINSLCMSSIVSSATPAGWRIFHKPDPALEQKHFKSLGKKQPIYGKSVLTHGDSH